MKILITAGGTSEPIDGVRRITNTSTGETGLELANMFHANGFEVMLLISKNSTFKDKALCNSLFFESHDDLSELFYREAKNNYDFIFHAAAVSDYKVSKICINGAWHDDVSKIKSGLGKIQLELVPSTKIINQIKNIAKESKLVAFKYTNTSSQEERLSAVSKLIQDSSCDYVLHNDASEKNQDMHLFRLFDANLGIFSEGKNKEDLKNSALQLIRSYL